ncbi:MAG TPA: ATP-binding protein [Longimicrobiales bacterium]
MPHSHFTSRPVLSLERKLPMLIGGLVASALVVTLLLVRHELRGSELDAAAKRLALVVRELTQDSTGLIRQRAVDLRATAEHPTIVGFLVARSNDVSGAQYVLDLLRTPADGDLPIQLRSATGRVLAATGRTDRRDNAGALPPRGTDVVYGRIEPGAEGYTYWISAPVRYGGSVVGHITQQRRGGSRSATLDRVQQLIGGDVSLFLANEDGGDWAGIDGEVLAGAPPVTDIGRPFTYSNGADTAYLAHAERLVPTPWLLVAQTPVTEVIAGAERVTDRIALLGFMLLTLALIAAWLISRRVTRPLNELGRVADAIARGDYSRRTLVQRRDEIGRLAGSFDAMAERIESTHAELKRRFREAQQLAGELELANARLHAAIRDAEIARAHAQQASRAKSEFLATMSHEIRTPINAIVGYADLLDLRIAGPLSDDQQNYIQRIRLSSEHLISVVNDVLDFAKMESGQLRLRSEVRDARPVIEDAVSILHARAEARRIRIRTACPAGANFLGDSHRVQQVLLNLLSNALKFTHEGGSVSVVCEQRESRGVGVDEDASRRTSWTCISVADDGPGIPPDQIGPIFEPFVQGASGYTRPHGGTGLGLAISRSLARMMGGDLTVESEIGRGSTFTIWLLDPSPAAVAAG